MNATIVIVDANREDADSVELFLKNENYGIHKCETAEEALRRIDSVKPDLAIIDVMLPEIDGFSLLRQIRQTYYFPIIMLSERDQEIDKITGLALGADDYVTKPFRPLELVARVKAQLRRSTTYSQEPQQEGDRIAFAGLQLNKASHECVLNGTLLTLTPTEFSILWILCENRGQVVSSERLFQEVWGEKYYSHNTNTVMVHIRNLREKMDDPAENPAYIKTVRGVGYKIER
ncbi:response regulator transcription factor [Brevibacillus borstelensis]|uniref:response regulator transcription factor n=1 Tax=Brevibacillus borstelensis TaxID=45462 RepID=UPI0030BF6650